MVKLHIYDYIVIFLYFSGVLASGIWFGRYTKSTKDFFLGGQRFSWWLVAVSCVATLVGSYSFLTYSELGYTSGLSSTVYYTNDWFILPIFMLGWLPIIYFSRVLSIPEYFGRRFDDKTRLAALCIIMLYLVGYIGINLHTIGKGFQGIFGDPGASVELLGFIFAKDSLILYGSAIGVGLFSIMYMHHGGQTSVIMTDLLQGFLLIGAGFLVFGLGIYHLGGFGNWLSSMPMDHKLPFPHYNTPNGFHAIGAFWSDAITASIGFYCMNQGILMRFMSVKSVRDGKKAICVVILVFMPIAAIAVSNAGWLGTALVAKGEIPADTPVSKMFVVVSYMVSSPGIFGFVIAALIAALMSTLDTLINAVSAIAVNDIWRPYISPGKDDKYYLRMARYFALSATGVGMLLVPIYNQFDLIMEGFTLVMALLTPSMVVVITLAIVWKRFTANAAFTTLVLGFAVTASSFVFPWMIEFIDHGVNLAAHESGAVAEGQYVPYVHMRAFFGTVASLVIAIVTTFLTKHSEQEETKGLTMASIDDAKRSYKGGEPSEEGTDVKLHLTLEVGEGDVAHLSTEDMEKLCAKPGDILFVADPRAWLGGLRSIQVKAGEPHDKPSVIRLSENLIDLGSLHLDKEKVTVEKLL
ncbi:sodium:solute symporter family protein [Candidatus Uabimicrobium amorphum]|uniref:Transporter n=1 Tax=Uabimicrobium amorphum TaxID=2596890 RepID=A0A5S9INE0_UABAM|nr:sodium:solute symporter family protein [Candidatus Uabimicrobium amorphum]BBM84914.1 transporter [Candidatus Uabimicrobium amorphum]